MLPLHKEAQSAQKGQNAHAGLWYDRFFNGFLEGAKRPDEKNKKEKDEWAANKTKWVKDAAKQAGDKALIERYCAQHKNLCQAIHAQTLIMSTDWHFVTGLGNNHPVENGFSWHHTLGIPYLTGAAVKGMVRAWCEVWEDGIDIQTWFGDTEQSGELIFFDAVPTAPVQLKADIMTPHYGDWYAKGGEIKDVSSEPEKVPADWHDPVPVPFLVVDKGASFQFAVAKRVEDSKIDLSEVMKALTQALEWIGAGAKTAAGYGRFSESKEAKMQREKEQREAARIEQERQVQAKAVQEAQELGLSGLAADIHSHALQAGWKEDKDMFMREVPDWLEKIEALDGDAQRQAATELAKYLEAHDKGILANPNKTKGKKNKPVYKPNAIKLAEALNKVLVS